MNKNYGAVAKRQILKFWQKIVLIFQGFFKRGIAERDISQQRHHSKSTGLMAEALGDYIFNRANKIVVDLEYDEKFKEMAMATEFNKLPRLKRLLDFYILDFWLASVACEDYYEHDDFQNICEGIEEGIIKSLESYGKANRILGVPLREFVKDKDELALLYREYPVDAETTIGFRALLAILIPKRFSDYHSTLSYKDGSIGLQRRSQYFCQHIFGKEYSNSYDGMIVAASFGLISSITFSAFSEYISELEDKFKKQVDVERTCVFLETLNNLTIVEEDCGTKNGISVSSLRREDKIIKSLKERIVGRFAVDDIVDKHTNKMIVSSGDDITKEKAKIIEEVGISNVRIRSIFTCESEYGVCLKCYGKYNLNSDAVKIGEKVGEEGAFAWGEIEVKGYLRDLIGGYKPQNPSVICEIDGVAEFADDEDGRRIIIVTHESGFKNRYCIPRNKKIKINNGEKVFVGQELTDGEINPHDVLRINGGKVFLEYMKTEILPYLSKVNFDERLIELLMRQITRLKIEYIGDTSFKIGQIVNRIEFMEENVRVMRNGKQPASASPIFIGINLVKN